MAQVFHTIFHMPRLDMGLTENDVITNYPKPIGLSSFSPLKQQFGIIPRF